VRGFWRGTGPTIIRLGLGVGLHMVRWKGRVGTWAGWRIAHGEVEGKSRDLGWA
jgi:hypothetical protein